jgi:drug/metabolite transporter (DMT)-like permease
MPSPSAGYKLGALYSLFTAALLATQHPFSILGAKNLSIAKYIFFTEVVLVVSVPLMVLSKQRRRDFRVLISTPAHLLKFAVLLVIGLLGVLLYNVGLGKAHPVVIAAVLNLAPFWAAIVALVVSKKAIPTSWFVFLGCLFVAFAGAMMIAISQSGEGSFTAASLSSSSLLGPWVFALPVPIFYALSGSLIGRWFSDFDDSASIAVTFTTAAVVLIPASLIYAYVHSDLAISPDAIPAIVLLMLGTAMATALGRVLYQVALTITGDDNGFVSMFFLLVPAVTALLSLAMSPWIADLKFAVGPLFYSGLFVVAAPIFLFSWQSWRAAKQAQTR